MVYKDNRVFSKILAIIFGLFERLNNLKRIIFGGNLTKKII